MANITIAGNSYVITSTVSMADLELVRKHRSKALKIVDKETQEELFAVGTGGNTISDLKGAFCFVAIPRARSPPISSASPHMGLTTKQPPQLLTG